MTVANTIEPASPCSVQRGRPATGSIAVVVLAGLLMALPASAQFKVVGPDGKVTYTDRAPPTATGRVTAIGNRAAASAGDAALPLEVRQAAARYPVTLYTMPGACEPCESARQLLRQRGIPMTEKLVASAEDSEALERLSGGRDAPTLGIGSQVLRGLAPSVWNSYLDAAGYPRESRLPASYQYPAPTPLTERREAAAARNAPTARAASAAEPDAGSAGRPAAPASGIRF
jgi:glutaredoxin